MRFTAWILVAACCLPAAAPAQEIPEHVCLKTTVPPTIDGATTDPAWKLAKPFPLYDVEDLDRVRLHSRPTEVRLLWDEEHLYFLFTATDPDVWSTYENRDDQIWQEEVVEIFIDPDGDGANYAEIEVNPLNNLFDLILSRPWSKGGRGFAQWDPDFAHAVAIDGTLNDGSDTDSRWTVEIALPWSALATDIIDVMNGLPLPPQIGDSWRLNLYRFERIREEGRVVRSEASAWSTIGVDDFHTPEQFGRLIFGESATSVDPGSWGRVKKIDSR